MSALVASTCVAAALDCTETGRGRKEGSGCCVCRRFAYAQATLGGRRGLTRARAGVILEQSAHQGGARGVAFPQTSTPEAGHNPVTAHH
jgi:hypothetical protein